jgi:hypothetical protein
MGAPIPDRPPRSRLGHRRQSPDGREVPVEIYHRGLNGLENLLGGHDLLGRCHPFVCLYLLRANHNSQSWLHKHSSAALDRPCLRRRYNLNTTLLLAIRQTPNPLALHPHPSLDRSLCVYRAPGDPPSAISRPHVRSSLRYSGGRQSSDHRHHQLGGQQPLAYLDAVCRNGEPLVALQTF